MYRRNDCYYFGAVNKYKIEPQDVSEVSYDGIIRWGEAGDVFQLDGIRNEKTVYFESSLQEWAQLIESGGFASIFKKKQVLFVGDRNGRIDGYAIVALPGVTSTNQEMLVIETGGEARVVHAILRKILSKHAVRITVPWQG
ncbi:hypothetical protein GCM10009001_05810 [Virgibacillus siamensis]|uniref:Uncharacterized protein n=1 Tax=Virgibacillus siamensis TaxID=480071 RepID=A0ABN1FK24_9BACI